MQSKVLWLCDLTDSNDEQEVIRTFVVLWERVKKRLEQTDIPKDVLTIASLNTEIASITANNIGVRPHEMPIKKIKQN